MAAPSCHHHHHRRRSPIRSHGPRPCFRKFKLRPLSLPRREFYSPIRRRGSPAVPRAKEEIWNGLGAGQEADLDFLRNESCMQTIPRSLKVSSGSGALTGRGASPSIFSPLPEVSPAKQFGASAGRSYPGLNRPGFRDPPDLRDLIHMKTRPPAPPRPPLAPSPLP